ncbi:MAG: hypothetical protein LBC09_02270 [Helicobacteraceae bacterium]|jgi:predicted DNA-binding protein|nr:hypothetical protein [Helicobacteraceae bacterium]
MNAKATYALGADTIQLINDLASRHGKSKTQIVREAISDYADSDDIDLAEQWRIADACDRGEMEVCSLEEMEERLQAKLKKAAIV